MMAMVNQLKLIVTSRRTKQILAAGLGDQCRHGWGVTSMMRGGRRPVFCSDSYAPRQPFLFSSSPLPPLLLFNSYRVLRPVLASTVAFADFGLRPVFDDNPPNHSHSYINYC